MTIKVETGRKCCCCGNNEAFVAKCRYCGKSATQAIRLKVGFSQKRTEVFYLCEKGFKHGKTSAKV